MQVYKTPIREYKFLLEDFLKLNDSKTLTDRSLEIDDLLMILEEASKIKNTDFKIFGKPATRAYRRMAVTLAYGKETTKELVEKAKKVASKIQVH